MKKNKLIITEFNEDFMIVEYENADPNEFILTPKGVDAYDSIIDAETKQHQKLTDVVNYYECSKHFGILMGISKQLNDEYVKVMDNSYLRDVIYHFNVLLGSRYPIDYRSEIPTLVFCEGADFNEDKRNVILSILQPFIFTCIDLRKVENVNKKALRGLNKFLKKEAPFEYNTYCTLANMRGFNSKLTDIRFEKVK